MGLSDLKFTEADFLNRKIADLSDTPNSDGMSAADLKAYFDYIPKTLIALTRLNSVIDIINGASGAGEVGASTISGVTGTTAQALLEGLKSLIDLRYTKDETDNLLSFKATNETVSKLVKNVDFDEDTGKFIFTFESGNTKVIDTAMEKITVNFSYDPDTQSLILIHVDGTTESISLAEFITNNEFEDSDTIAITVTDGIVKAEIQPGSITDDMLSSALLTALVNHVSSAADSAGAAASSETNAGTYAQTASTAAETATQKAKKASDSADKAENAEKLSESYAKGGTGTREGEDTDNAKYYATEAAKSEQAAKRYKEEAKDISGGDFVTSSTYDADMAAVKKSINNQIVVFENITVQPGSFVADSTYTGYPYKAVITCEGITEDYISDVVFSPKDSAVGILAPVSEAGNGCVTIYANAVPEDAVSVLTVECRKVSDSIAGGDTGGEISEEDIATDEEVREALKAVFGELN